MTLTILLSLFDFLAPKTFKLLGFPIFGLWLKCLKEIFIEFLINYVVFIVLTIHSYLHHFMSEKFIKRQSNCLFG